MKYRFQKLLQLHLQLFDFEMIATPCLNTLLQVDERLRHLGGARFFVEPLDHENRDEITPAFT